MLSGSFGFAWVHSGEPRGRLVHLRSRGFPLAHLDVVGFIRRSRGFTRAPKGIVGSFGFAWLHSGAWSSFCFSWVISISRCFCRARLGDVGFNRRRFPSLGCD